MNRGLELTGPSSHHRVEEPQPWDMSQPLSVPRREGPDQGPPQNTYRDLILDLAAYIPLRLHGALAAHHTREEELLGNGHPGVGGSEQRVEEARGLADWRVKRQSPGQGFGGAMPTAAAHASIRTELTL